MLFIVFSLNVIFGKRRVRLKHPKDELFVGGKNFYPKFVQIGLSEIFIDKPVDREPGDIIIQCKDRKPKVWDIEGSGKNLIFYNEHGGKNQRFRVIHIARDVIAIRSEIGDCITYTDKNKKFKRKKCQTEKRFKNQIFLITTEGGIWKGSGNFEIGWGSPGEEDVSWGKCEGCIEGGLGNEQQGIDYDNLRWALFHLSGFYPMNLYDMRYSFFG